MPAKPSLPGPRRKLWRTRLKRPRKLRGFAPRLHVAEIFQPAVEAALPGGEVTLLYDVIVALHRDGTISWLHHTVAQVFGEQELAAWDRLGRVDSPGRSKQSIFRAFVHLPDGSRRKARKVQVLMNNNTRLTDLTFHPLRPGVIVELEEQLDEFKPLDIAPGLWYRMPFRSQEARRRVRFTVAIAAPFSGRRQLHHFDVPPREWTDGDYTVWQWDERDLAGIDPDEWTPPPTEFLPWIDVTTLASWDPVAGFFRRELSPPRLLPNELKALVRELTDGREGPREKATALYDYATQTIRYGRPPAQEFLETPRGAQEMLHDLRGDCKDKSALLVAMLRSAGIPAEIVLVQTSLKGRFAPLPAPWFDHAIVLAKVDGDDVWLDPAGGPSTFGELPSYDCGVAALPLDGKPASLGTTPAATPEANRVERRGSGTLDPAGGFTGALRVAVSGDRAGEMRTACRGVAAETQVRRVTRFESFDLPNVEISEMELEGLDDLARDVRCAYRIDLAEWGRRIGELWLLRIPWIETRRTMYFPGESQRAVPCTTPLPIAIHEAWEISLPEGSRPYSLPFQIAEECRWGRYRCSVREFAGKLICRRELEFLGGNVSPEEFAEWKQFRDATVRSDNADFVLLPATAAGELLPLHLQPARSAE